MKKSSAIEQQLAVLRQQLTQAKKHERRVAERQFIKLAKSLGIYGLSPEQLTREFHTVTKASVTAPAITLRSFEEVDHEQA